MFRFGATASLMLAMALSVPHFAHSNPPGSPSSADVFEIAAPCKGDREGMKRAPRPGHARYDICANQMELLSAGLVEAVGTGKLVLVEIGATWCSWCAVLQRQLHDRSMTAAGFDIERAFHIVPIGISTLHHGQRADIPSGRAVLNLLLARANGTAARTTPFIAIIDPRKPDRVFARNLDDLVLTGEGRFDATRLAAMLRDAHNHVRHGSRAPSEPGWFKRKLLRWWYS